MHVSCHHDQSIWDIRVENQDARAKSSTNVYDAGIRSLAICLACVRSVAGGLQGRISVLCGKEELEVEPKDGDADE